MHADGAFVVDGPHECLKDWVQIFPLSGMGPRASLSSAMRFGFLTYKTGMLASTPLESMSWEEGDTA